MKTKKIRIRQGFTIVELVIVIGVIGVLAAVLIPTFVNLNNKANRASDESLVKNLNTALAMQEQDPKDTKNATMQDAVEDLKEYGYLLPNLVTKSDEKLLWNQKTNRFVLEGENKNGYENLDFWRIQDTVKGDEIYSIYAGLNFKGNGADESIVNVTVGFDAGYNDALTAVNYTRTGAAQKAIIRTAGGALTINGKNDDVLHYGEATSVSVVDIASTSYHENGEVKFLEITAGHVVVEESASINAIHFNATNGEFKNEENKTISVDLSNANVEDISFSRDPVDIAQDGTYVAEVTTDSTEYLWLFGEGIKEQMVVTTNEGPIAEGGTLKSGISVGAEDGSVAEQIATPAKRNDAGQLVDDNDEVIDLSTVDLTKSDALDGSEVVVEDVPSKETIIDGQTYFDGGVGSEIDPFIISNREEMQNISNFYDKGYNFFRVKDGVKTIDCANWTAVNLNGSFDGKGIVFENLDCQLFRSVGVAPSDEVYTIKDITINANINISGYGAAAIRQAGNNLVLDGVNVHGYIEGNNGASSFVCFGPGNITTDGNDKDEAMNWIFRNCYSDATIVATGDVAVGFVKHPYCAASQAGGSAANQAKCLITVEDSIFEGKLCALSGNFKTKYFVGNANDMLVKTSYSADFLNKYGDPEGRLYATPTAKTAEGVFFIGNYPGNGPKIAGYGDYGTCIDNYMGSKSALTVTVGTLPNKYSNFTVNKVAGAVSAKITLEIAPNGKNETGAFLGTFMSETIDLSGAGATFTSTDIRYFDIAVNAAGVTSQGVSADGKTFNIYDGGAFYGTTYSSAAVRAVQYDSNGNVINITTFTFAK